MENVVENTEVTASDVVAPIASEEVTVPGFTADDLAKAREQEKAKLYPQLEKMKEELATLKKAREEEETRRAQFEAQKEAERLAQENAKAEEELSAKDLLKKKEQEFQSMLETERLERERAFALLDQERKFQELMNYRQQRVEQERDNIVPELIDLVDGNTADEVEQSIAMLKEKSARILSSAQQAMQSARQQMAGTRITNPAAGPLDNDSEQKSYSPDSIREMSLADYAKQRAKLLGTAASNRGQGLFG
jgi:membrane-associated HD superfamily phosphohydrolase